MEFYAQKSDLLGELELVQGAVEKKSTIPILSHVLLEVAGFNLSMSATDLELATRCSCPAKMKAPGTATVPAKRLLEIVRSLPDGEIRFKLLENNWIQVTCDRSSFKIVGLAKDNFPTLPVVPAAVVKIPAEVLGGLIDRTIFAVSQDESRFTLSGALLVLKQESVGMVATDGHRLALVERRVGVDGLQDEVRMLIPKRAMGELRRLVAESPEEAGVSIAKDDSHLFFSVAQRLAVARQLAGQFPNYEAVLPRENDKVVELDQELVSAAIRRVAVLADERSHAVRLKLDQGRLEISSSGGDYGEANESLDVAYNQEALQAGFNYQYLLDFFSVAGKGGTVRLELKDAESAVQFRPVDQALYDYRYVVMPLRV